MSEKQHVKTLTELRDEAEKTIAGAITGHDDFVPQFRREADALTFALSAIEEPRDEYHTMKELYEYRMLYNAHAAHGWVWQGIPVVKSWKHSDGELCFGGGWFIVSAQLPTGQVSNHYKAEFWDLFDVPEVELPPEYDGHSPKDAADRLFKAIQQQGE